MIPSRALRYTVNIGLFQLGWFACIFLPGTLLLTVLILFIVIHFYWLVLKEERRYEIHTMIKVLFVGAIVEFSFFSSGLLVNKDASILPPLWIMAMWLLFGTLLNHSLVWLRGRYLLAAICALASAPLSYYAGSKLQGDVVLGYNSAMSLLFIGMVWAIAFPFILKITRL